MAARKPLDSEFALNSTGILVMLVVGALSVYVAFESDRAWIPVGLLSLLHLVTFLVFITAWAERSTRRMRTLLWLEAALILSLYWLVNVSFIAILGIIWIVQAAELYGSRAARPLLIGAVVTFAVSQFYHWAGTDMLSAVVSSITLGLFHMFALSATVRAMREAELRSQSAALNRELIATRDLLSQSTRQNERVRIARDLHDLLGHHMTALILNLEVAAHVADGAAREKVEQSQSLARLLLSDLRTAVSELREDDTINLEQAINKLVADIPGLEFELDFTTAPPVKDLATAETLLRCIQESVTNVLKHSDADRCRIALEARHGDYVLTVTDNGSKSGEITPGNGLTGMLERVGVRGGSLSWGRQPNGFSLQVQIPTAAGR